MLGTGWRALLAAGLLLTAATSPAAAPADDVLVPLEQYTTTKGKSLGTAHHARLLRLSERLQRCLPWVEVQPAGIGFKKPRFASADDRYLSTWIVVDQKDDGRFGAMGQERRVSAMFSRYGVDLLRRMNALDEVRADRDVEGYSVVISWTKPGTDGPARREPVNETIALFIDKASAAAFLAGQLPGQEFVDRARFFVFDGKTEIGRLPLEVWQDPFLQTYRAGDASLGSGC